MTDKKSEPKDIIETVKAYRIKSEKFIQASNNANNAEAGQLAEGLLTDRITLKRLLRDYPMYDSLDPISTEVLRGIRDNNDRDPLVGWLKKCDDILEEKREEKREEIERLYPGILDEYGMYWDAVLDDKEPTEEQRVAFEKIQRFPFPASIELSLDELNSNEYFRYPDNRDEDPIQMLASTSGYDLFDFYVRRIEVGALILSSSGASPASAHLFNEVRECYAFEQFPAALVLCRALLEETLKRYKKIKYDINSESEIKNLWKRDLYDLTHDEKTDNPLNLPDEVKVRIDKVRLAAKEIIHRGLTVKCDKDETLRHILDTRSVLEMLSDLLN